MSSSANSGATRTMHWDRANGALVPSTGDVATRNHGRFIKGPIPLDWVLMAANLPGQSLTVGITIWYLAGLTKCQSVRISNEALAPFGVKRDAKRRALRELESAGLITVSWGSASSPIATIIVKPPVTPRTHA